MRVVINTIILLLLLLKCSQPNGQKEQQQPVQQKKPLAKPGASNADTMLVRGACVVLYGPDSVQKEKIRRLTPPAVFQSSMHEFFYQQRNARIFLKQYWPQLKVINVDDKRFLWFIKNDGSTELIDLDSKGDSYGMFAFDGVHSPQQLDMMNVESAVPAYFKK